MMLPFLLLAAACFPVRDPVLHGSDLAAADSSFAAIDPAVSLGYAPAPGSRRVFSEAEMIRLAKRFGVDATPHEICFQYAMKKLDAALVSQAMQEVLPTARIEVVETVNIDVPEGKLIFSTASLPKPPAMHPDEPVIWRGYVEYAPNRRFTIWAKVRAIATTAVVRGDDVVVHVEVGGAQLKLSARAESGAAIGETVKLRNPKSGKLFEALVTGKGTANLKAPLPEDAQ